MFHVSVQQYIFILYICKLINILHYFHKAQKSTRRYFMVIYFLRIPKNNFTITLTRNKNKELWKCYTKDMANNR